MASLNSHGLEPREEAIMDLYDLALSEAQIAARLGLSLATVRTVTTNLGENDSDRWALRAPAASAQLAAAIARMGA